MPCVHILWIRPGVLLTTVQNGDLERSGLSVVDNINTTAEVTLAFEDVVNQMFVPRSQSAE